MKQSLHSLPMNAKASDWPNRFKQIYDRALERYRAGNRDAQSYFTSEEASFLASIGARPMEVYDFAEDEEDLPWETALLITSARRDYFLSILHGRASDRRLKVEEFPAKDAELDGIPWLPRLILKAKARLRGELPDELMYCCGGDRKFFRDHDIHPADFLRLTWAVDGDERKLLAYVRGDR